MTAFSCLVAIITLAGAAGVSVASTDSTAAPPIELPERIPPLPALVAYADSHAIPVGGIEPMAERFEGTPGDCVTILVTFHEGARPAKQWLIHAVIDSLTPGERRHADDSTIKMTVENYRLAYSAKPDVAFAVRTIGPFPGEEADPLAEKAERVLVASGFMGLGLAAGSRVSLGKHGDANGGAPVQWTEEEARTVGGRAVAVIEFLRLIRKTPGLDHILSELVKRPPIFSLIRHRGVRTTFAMSGDAVVPPSAWPLTDRTLYRFDLQTRLNGRPALNSILVVAEPRPPLLPIAGVVGLVATPPDRDDVRMDLELLAARAAAAIHASP